MQSRLEEILASEEKVETFLESLDQEFEGVDLAPMTPIAPSYEELTHGNIKIVHGQHDQDYVWHLSPLNPRQKFKATEEQVIRSIATIMNGVIPESVTVNIHKPLIDWEIQEYTFKALNLMDHWSVTKEVIRKLNLELFTASEKLL